MSIEYLGLSEISGPLVVLEGIQDAFYEEVVEFVVDKNRRKKGRIIAVDKDKAVIQVFDSTDDMSLKNTHTRLNGRPMEIGLSLEILGRTFNGLGEPIDGLGRIAPEVGLLGLQMTTRSMLSLRCEVKSLASRAKSSSSFKG